MPGLAYLLNSRAPFTYTRAGCVGAVQGPWGGIVHRGCYGLEKEGHGICMNLK